MKTRFDVYGHWITARGEVVSVSDMETTHILNTMRMLIQKPSRTMSMLITDVENCTFCAMGAVWVPTDVNQVTKESIHNITSMSVDDLKKYVTKTPLFQSFCAELAKRGVNVDNIITLLDTCEAF